MKTILMWSILTIGAIPGLYCAIKQATTPEIKSAAQLAKEEKVERLAEALEQATDDAYPPEQYAEPYPYGDQ